MANIKISDLRLVEADVPVLSLTDKELRSVSGGWNFIDDWWLNYIDNEYGKEYA
ncbi:hypothetical protein H6G97_45650 [Nostoc flagelliforme FACHB-838]|uniref:Uncharacterized protein n=1 Tax=Nostoc flagelliforme FACHB-838 TaxID=2692904 RepID=A0ABR8E541_9NOSO|nr:hypothetical protein [Nostoc flagelliforme]MBD2536202.1 hypothetical protein [Nostoc flagelliforme FACHB-838]